MLAADDFATIRARMKELLREQEDAPPKVRAHPGGCSASSK